VTPLLLANENKPTPPEKQAIKVWLSVREQAQQYQLEHRGPPSPLLVRTRQQVTRAILQLYNGEMTYGEFAKRIQELDSEYQAAARRQ
jgi:O6-methylguanine-DNA--protein-cysteine methyltransferase